MEDPNIDQVIFKNLHGEPTTNDIEILRKWLNESDENKSTFNLIKGYWENSQLEVTSPDLDKAYAKLKSNSTLNQYGNHTNYHLNNGKKEFLWYKVAAVFVFFIAFGGLMYYLNSTYSSGIEIAHVQEIIKENPKGQKLITYLPDGSKVILNSQSKIKYTSPFLGNERQIELDGEAFFKVKKDSLKPFRVISNGISTTALGTSFNVNSKQQDHVEVALVTGNVRVSKFDGNSVILTPGKSALVNQHGDFNVQEFDYETKVGWKDGILVFHDDSLPEILIKLEDWYGVEFVTDEALEESYNYRSRYQNETLEEVLRGIAFVHNLDYEISGDTIRIFKN